jgi:two-component SAPR family response regulator
MPIMNGVELGKALREKYGALNLKVVLITGDDGLTPHRKAIFDMVYVKPFTCEKLRHLIDVFKLK